MIDQGLNYGVMMQRALRSVMADALRQVAANGLPGDHHIYITYDSRHPAVVMPDWLLESYPEEITIVLQHEFYDLEVSEDGFGVGMSFSDKPATLFVPFDAVYTFVDPSVEFGLKFEASEPPTDQDTRADAAATDASAREGEEADAAEGGGADVVSLDQFRKT